MRNDPLDIVSLAIALVALIASPQVAAMVGPYAAIALLAITGAGIALSGNNAEMTNWQACKYVSIRVLLALVLTVALAKFVQVFWPGLQPIFTLIPVAFGIGWIRDYNKVIEWFGSILKRKAEKGLNDDQPK